MCHATQDHPPDYRQQVVDLARSGESAEKLSQRFEPSAKTLRDWVRAADREGCPSLCKRFSCASFASSSLDIHSPWLVCAVYRTPTLCDGDPPVRAPRGPPELPLPNPAVAHPPPFRPAGLGPRLRTLGRAGGSAGGWTEGAGQGSEGSSIKGASS